MRPHFRPMSEATKKRKAANGGMNDTEAAFNEHLRRRAERNEFLAFGFHQRSLLIAKGAKYTPDFVVLENDGTTTYYEVKGSKRTKPSKRFPLGGIVPVATEAAKVRIKVAAEKYPDCTFVMVWPNRGEWLEKDYSAKARNGGGA